MVKVAFIGLGVMGYPMAGHLAKAGHDVTVWNRSSDKATRWTGQHKGRAAATPKEAAARAEFVMACVGNDDDLRSVTYGESGILAGLAKGAVFVDHTTASADVAREIGEKAKAAGQGFIDAPVSGGQAGAENGQLTIMCGGDAAIYERVKPVIQAYAKMQNLMGPTGSGQLTKMMNQICIAGLVQGLSEALAFGRASGLDLMKAVEVISKGAAGSWQMDNRHKTMIEGKFDYGFAVDWMRKDLGICLAEARRNGTSLPVAALVDQFYAEVQQMGGNRWDTSSLIARLEATKTKK
ncbi:NAD(P)-dependent oxidoreductase [Ferrovibrio sp.]|uniref:NAD(P)-dependent oxidoreductase n=1 Tax=Ferrovibrio sp. TaxID=1917215 RepID=UPI00311E677E